MTRHSKLNIFGIRRKYMLIKGSVTKSSKSQWFDWFCLPCDLLVKPKCNNSNEVPIYELETCWVVKPPRLELLKKCVVCNSGRGLVVSILEFDFFYVCLSPLRYFTCLLGLQGIQQTWGLFVIRVSWPKYLKLLKTYKKNMLFSLLICD